MPYNTETGQYERRSTTIIDSTPDGDNVNTAVAVKNNTGIDDSVTDLNHHNINGGHYPALSVAAASRYLKQSAAGAVSWANGVPIEDAAQSDLSNVTTAAVEAKVTAATILTKIKTVDGTGTGLDADLLDGQDSTFYRNATNLNAGTINAARLPAASESARGGVELATLAELQAFTDGARAISPQRLGGIKSDAINSTSSNTLATSKAVHDAYEAAVSGGTFSNGFICITTDTTSQALFNMLNAAVTQEANSTIPAAGVVSFMINSEPYWGVISGLTRLNSSQISISGLRIKSADKTLWGWTLMMAENNSQSVYKVNDMMLTF